MLTANMIGAGLLGKSIGRMLQQNHLIQILGISNKTEESTLAAIQFIGDGQYYPTIEQLPTVDIIFIATPDDAIPLVCEQLFKNKALKTGCLIVHFSGSQTSDTLISLKEKGCFIASIHPMTSFAKPELSIEQFKGTYCAIEGDEQALQQITTLFTQIGGIVYPINKEKKSLYHLAGVFASNYLITLADIGMRCLKQSGVDENRGLPIITSIMRNTLTNLEKTNSPQASLTGPIQRGDTQVVQKHLQCLSDETPKKIYAYLGLATLELINHDKKSTLKALLSNEDPLAR